MAEHILAQRAIANLLSNAIRHTPPGGEIRAASSSRPPMPWNCVSATPGPGIPPGHLERVFDRFYQVDGARERSEAGPGWDSPSSNPSCGCTAATPAWSANRIGFTIFTLRFPASRWA